MSDGKTFRVLVIGGSLRKGSYNRHLMNALPELAPANVEIVIGPSFGDIPLYDADLQAEGFPEPVRKLGDAINRWAIVPTGSEGYKKAEVTLGGVDTRALSQQTMMANAVPGLYFIGETIDVTGWLGGYNFQWAWASGVAAGQAIA